MTILHIGYFMKTFILIGDTLDEIDLRELYNYTIYPKASKITTDNGQT